MRAGGTVGRGVISGGALGKLLKLEENELQCGVFFTNVKKRKISKSAVILRWIHTSKQVTKSTKTGH